MVQTLIDISIIAIGASIIIPIIIYIFFLFLYLVFYILKVIAEIVNFVKKYLFEGIIFPVLNWYADQFKSGKRAFFVTWIGIIFYFGSLRLDLALLVSIILFFLIGKKDRVYEK